MKNIDNPLNYILQTKSFEDIVIEALNKVDEIYFGYERNHEGWLNSINANLQTRRIEFRHYERVFCNELYFQIKTLLIANNFSNHILFAEFQKEFLKEMTLSKLNYTQLSKRFIPDFLIHNPIDNSLQELIIEIKTRPNILIREFDYDILKIVEFIEYSKYKKGMFIAANNDLDEVKIQINKSKKIKVINSETRGKILIVTRSNGMNVSKVSNLNEILIS